MSNKKGIIVFSKVNDVVFYKLNSELKNHLLNVSQNSTGSEKDENKNAAEGFFRNTLVQIFSPLVTSQRIMANQFDNTYTSVECEDGLFVIFSQKWSYSFLCINHTEETSLFAAQKNLNVFIEYVKMLCGPATHVLSDCHSRHKVFQNSKENVHLGPLLHVLMDLWDDLYEKELMYLVEGVERLLINRNLSCTCVNLMENVLTKMRGANTSYQELFCHAFLLVDTKLLSLFSSRNAGELDKGDLLMLIGLVEVLDKIVPLSPTPKEQKDDFEATDFLLAHHHHLAVFLRSKIQSHPGPVPHMMHTIKINDRLKVVLLAELPCWSVLSSSINMAVDMLYNVLSGPTESTRCAHTKSTLDQAFQRISGSIKKLKYTGDQERIARTLVTKWDNLKKCGLDSYLHSSSKLVMTSRLEIMASSLCESLQEAYESLVLYGIGNGQPYHQMAPESVVALRTVEDTIRQKLLHYSDYLLVKANQNVTMASYIQDFPGLLHYIYLDRNSGYMIAPSINEECTHKCKEYVAVLTKSKVWEMVEFGFRHLQKESLTLLWQDENFYYSYFLWFEDLSGKPLKPNKIPSFKNYPLPGIVGGDFYRKMISDSFPSSSSTPEKVQCYELFMTHVGVATPPMILEQAKQLAASIWSISSIVNTPIDNL